MHTSIEATSLVMKISCIRGNRFVVSIWKNNFFELFILKMNLWFNKIIVAFENIFHLTSSLNYLSLQCRYVHHVWCSCISVVFSTSATASIVSYLILMVYFIAVVLSGAVYLTSTQPVSVVQIIQSQTDLSQPADPSMILIPPAEQYMSMYHFIVPVVMSPDGYCQLLHSQSTVVIEDKSSVIEGK